MKRAEREEVVRRLGAVVRRARLKVREADAIVRVIVVSLDPMIKKCSARDNR
jgi:hypothetical protein